MHEAELLDARSNLDLFWPGVLSQPKQYAVAPGHKSADYSSSRGQPFNGPITYEAALALPQERLEQTVMMPSRKMSQWQDEVINAFPFS